MMKMRGVGGGGESEGGREGSWGGGMRGEEKEKGFANFPNGGQRTLSFVLGVCATYALKRDYT